jgi:hypothetical protein
MNTDEIIFIVKYLQFEKEANQKAFYFMTKKRDMECLHIPAENPKGFSMSKTGLTGPRWVLLSRTTIR